MRQPSAEIARVVSGVLRALSICVPVALVDAPAAPAQAVAPATLVADIPAQSLAQALGEFARHTGLQLVYISSVVRDKKSHAVSAGLSVNEALTRLLKGTGLRFEYLTPDTIDILAAAPSEKRTQTPPEGEPLQVIVTASRREELLQDVPITIQAITGDQLRELNVATFHDLLKFTTNITYTGSGPGTGNIFIRGLGSYDNGNQGQATIAPFPNVALYLDEQAMQFPARNNDVYMVDLQRVEVLEGPQGTLFGGGAEAGAIRYITNKPKLDITSGESNAGYGVTANGGNPNTQLSAVLNIPLISNTLAVRAVIFSERQGGYIDNVPGTISFDKRSYSTYTGERLRSPIVNNIDLVRSNTNPVTYGGLRLSGLYQFNDDLDLLIQQSYQDMHADGYFYAYPFASNGEALQPYQITAFTPAYTKDRYESTAWTLNGRFGDLKAVYAGSYMVRHIEGQQDYSNYVSSAYNGPYYDCIGPGAFQAAEGKPLKCYPPIANWHDSVQNEHQSHEVRVSTSEEHRVRALLGAYWEKFVIDDQMNWNYLGIPQCDPSTLAKAQAGGPDCLSAVGPVPGSWASDPRLRENMNNAYGEDVQRGYKQYAFFASVDFDIVPKVLTVTAGTRRYRYDEFEEGSVWLSGNGNPLILDHPNGACTAKQECGYPLNLAKSESGFRSRASLTWHITPDVMTYYIFSQGFRPGGFNGISPAVGAALPYCTPVLNPPPPDPRCRKGGSLFGQTTNQYAKPAGFQSDNLINNELGLKSEFLNHRVLVNASAYRMQWNDVQLLLYDPLNAVGVIVNGPNYTINGVELQLAARVTEGFTVQGASSWNSSNQTSAPCLRSAGAVSSPYNPTPAGQCITVVQQHAYNNPFGSLNSSLPFSPPILFNVRARYDWAAGPYKPFAWVGASHIGSMHNEPANFPDGNGTEHISPLLRYTIPAYTIYDAAIGVSKDNWTVQLTGNNLTNVYGPTNLSSAQFIRSEIPLRPRVLMANFAYRF